MATGWIKLHREMLAWEWYQDANTMRVFLHLLLTANYEDKKYKGVVIKRGQCMTSIRKLSENLGLTMRHTRTALDHLKATGEVTIETTHKYSIITISNYEIFQGVELSSIPVDNFDSDTVNDMPSDTVPTHGEQKSDTVPTHLHYLRNKELLLSKKERNARAHAREEPVDNFDEEENLFGTASREWRLRDGEV